VFQPGNLHAGGGSAGAAHGSRLVMVLWITGVVLVAELVGSWRSPCSAAAPVLGSGRRRYSHPRRPGRRCVRCDLGAAEEE